MQGGGDWIRWKLFTLGGDRQNKPLARLPFVLQESGLGRANQSSLVEFT